MKNKIYGGMTVALATVSLFITACEDEISTIGNSISSSDVTINVDSITTRLAAHSIDAPAFESRSGFTMLGSIDVPEYGSLKCSYVTEFLPAETLSIPDTITPEKIDSVKLILSVPKIYITGDTLAPQQLTAYMLNRQLPADVKGDFDPAGYYDAGKPAAVKNYTLSGYTFGESTYGSNSNVKVKAKLPLEFGRDLVEQYRDHPDLFVWPQEFAKYCPGVYVENSFGKGCVAPVQTSSVYLYYPKTKTDADYDENGNIQYTTTVVADSVCAMITAPEVLSNVSIDYRPSELLQNAVAEGRSIITTPGGYAVSFRFPAEEILDRYWSDDYDLGVINNMIFSIPAKTIGNQYGIEPAPSLLMVKTSEMATYFAEGKLPDNVTSFYSNYSAAKGAYAFNYMRQYIVDLKNKGAANITNDDVEFTLIPISISTEDYTNTSTGTLVTTVTAMTPYILKPTMVELDTDHAEVNFTYSNQSY